MAAVGVTVPLHGSCAPSLQARKVRSGKTRAAVKTEPPSWDERVVPQLGEKMIRLLIVNGILPLPSWTLWSIPTTVVFHQAANCQREKLSERSNEKYSRKKSHVHHPWVAKLSPATALRCQLIAFGVKLDSYGAASGLMICPKNLAFKFFWRYLQAATFQTFLFFVAIRAETPVDSVDLSSPRHTPSESQVSMNNTFPTTFGRVTKVFVSWGMVNLSSSEQRPIRPGLKQSGHKWPGEGIIWHDAETK